MSTHHDVQALPAEQREHILRGFGLGWWRQLGQVAIVLGVVLLACWYVGLLDATTLLNGLPSIATLQARPCRQTFRAIEAGFAR